MAISHAQALLLLFVSIFILPAALGTAVEVSNCQHHLYFDVVKVTKVDIDPYPIKFHDKSPTFNITAVTSQSLEDRMLNIDFTSPGDIKFGITNLRYKLCDATKCPIEPGRPFVITLTNIYAVQRTDHLSGEYNVSVYIYDRADRPSSLDMCASFKFHASALAEFANNPITNGVSVSRVEIYPSKVTVNDNPIFRITAVSPKNISSSSTVSASMFLVGESELLQSSRRGYELCDSSDRCPIKPGTFVITFPHPYWRYTMKPGRYQVRVIIINQVFPYRESMNLLFWFSVSKA